MARYLLEPPAGGAARVIANEVAVCDLAAMHPALWEHLSETSWGSGKTRVTSTLMVFVEEGLVKLCLHDRALGRSCWLSGPTLTKVLVSLDLALQGDTVEWRRDRIGSKRGQGG